jgi:hypothetical protein
MCFVTVSFPVFFIFTHYSVFGWLVKCLPLVPQVLESYNEEVMYVYDNYFKNVAKECREKMGEDNVLPLSGTRIVPREPFNHSTEGNVNCNYHRYQNKLKMCTFKKHNFYCAIANICNK